ncbi:hypothetical protein niasHT_000602 [Heterodera trifolii]|uniref:Glycoside hydrolase family 5 domain-containing protein n=1 Tax=Heterodera trifolii TaxID=157864 RepID=A0ABD2LZ53_9BILA
MLIKQLFLLFAFSIAFVASVTPPPYGQLSVSGTKLVGANGQPVQLIGYSLGWHQWWPQYWNAQTIKALKCSMNGNVVRAAMGVDSGGYMTDPNTAYRLTVAVIEAAIAEGIYVIVDWHSHEPHADEAAAFFTKIAKAYGKYPHVLYEDFNEPKGFSWNDVLVPYHKKVISAIRAVDPKNVIILGTNTWSQDVDVAAQNPIKGYQNLMYTLHFYAASHFVEDLGNKLRTAVSKGLPIFVTEFGVCEASGDGRIDTNSMQKWWSLLDQYKISYVNWAIADKSETCSALNPGTSASSVGDSNRWKPSIKMVVEYNKKKATGISCGGGGSANSGKSNGAKKSG